MEMNPKQMTLWEYMGGTCHTQTFGVSEHLVKTFPWLANVKDLTETEVAWLEKCSDCLKKKNPKIDPNGLSTRMLKECCQAIMGGTMQPFKLKWGNVGTMSSTSCSTQKISEFPRIGKECILSDILEEKVDEKYFLSQSAVDRLVQYKDTTIEPLVGGSRRETNEGERTSQVSATLTTRNPVATAHGVYPCKMSYKNGIELTDVSPTLLQRDYKGIANYGSIGGVIHSE